MIFCLKMLKFIILGARIKRVKAMKSEITVIRRKLALQANGKFLIKKGSSKKNLHQTHLVGNKTQKPVQPQPQPQYSEDQFSG